MSNGFGKTADGRQPKKIFVPHIRQQELDGQNPGMGKELE
jgi:hypothetical protein